MTRGLIEELDSSDNNINTQHASNTTELCDCTILDHKFMLRIAYWLSSHNMEEGLNEELFNETYGTVMGKHYYQKWEHTYSHDIMKITVYFGLDSKNGQLFYNMVLKQMTLYEQRIGRKSNQ